ncbi:helix-turn-helix transcriptional regulator [Microbacterium paraoxydans]|uniref:helix-turn-helix domain-containing protein n=1 Tax=Microbacterium paraoxydans TaxID=199592 RepID=UPI003444929C
MPETRKTMRNVDKTFGPTLREARERRGLSQAALAEAMQALGFDFQQQTIYKIESGNRRATIGEAAGFARALQLDDVGSLVNGKNSLAVSLVLRPVQSAYDDVFFASQRLLHAQLEVARLVSKIDDDSQLPERQIDNLRDALRFDPVSIATEALALARGSLEHDENISEPIKAIMREAWRTTDG